MDKLIGVPPITITRLEGDTYINCTNQIDQGVKGSLAVYKDDSQAITHTTDILQPSSVKGYTV